MQYGSARRRILTCCLMKVEHIRGLKDGPAYRTLGSGPDYLDILLAGPELRLVRFEIYDEGP